MVDEEENVFLRRARIRFARRLRDHFAAVRTLLIENQWSTLLIANVKRISKLESHLFMISIELQSGVEKTAEF